jgi:hypothetical protein
MKDVIWEEVLLKGLEMPAYNDIKFDSKVFSCISAVQGYIGD